MVKTIVCIEGNISSGKSTLVGLLEQRLGDRYSYMMEPVGVWQGVVNEKGNNILECFYNDMQGNAVLLQQVIMSSRVDQIEHAMKSDQSNVYLSERSIHSCNRVFGHNLAQQGVITDIQKAGLDYIYGTYDKSMQERGIRHVFIYLRTDPEVCFRRLNHRARLEESGVSLDYLQQLHNQHEEWFSSIDIKNANSAYLTLDGGSDFKSDESVLAQMLLQVEQFIKEQCN